MSAWVPDVDEVLKTRDGYVADKLREAILRGELRPGQKLDQNDVAELLHVSRSPVREALRTLAGEGLVVIHPHRTATVAELSIDEFEDLYHIRFVLEGMATRIAAASKHDDRIAIL